jgi:hypothetical protein
VKLGALLKLNNRLRFGFWQRLDSRLSYLPAVPPGSFNVCTGFSRDIADSSGIQCWMPRWRLGLGESGPMCSVQSSDQSACSSRVIRRSSRSTAAHVLYIACKRNRFGLSISWPSRALNAPFRRKSSLIFFISRKNRMWFSGATSISIAAVIGPSLASAK